MNTKGRLSKPELFFSLPVSFIFIGVAIWNWFHGFSHFINWFWLLIGLNRLTVLARKACPRWQGILKPLGFLAALILIILTAYTAFRYYL